MAAYTAATSITKEVSVSALNHSQANIARLSVSLLNNYLYQLPILTFEYIYFRVRIQLKEFTPILSMCDSFLNCIRVHALGLWVLTMILLFIIIIYYFGNLILAYRCDNIPLIELNAHFCVNAIGYCSSTVNAHHL